jgi:FtsH-binding integral membrane protein
MERTHGVMSQPIALILYVVFCVLVGLCGSQRRMGFIGTFIVSLLFTPVLVLIILLLTGPSSRVAWERRPQRD